MKTRPCIIGLDLPESSQIQSCLPFKAIMHDCLPKIVVRDGVLLVTPPDGFGLVPASHVVFHGIFENDHDLLAGLALWGGPCLPNAQAMMNCRLKLPCLVRALGYTQFGKPARGFASAGVEFVTDHERVAKWGNWHCGENKQRFRDSWISDETCIIEPYLEGSAVRVVVIGNRAWQIRLEGNDWLKSIHHPQACLMDLDARLVNDTQHVARCFGLEIAANDYIVTSDGEPHLLEVNHIPNVTRFPEIWKAYEDYVVDWLVSRVQSEAK